jgi:hypothetical protein
VVRQLRVRQEPAEWAVRAEMVVLLGLQLPEVLVLPQARPERAAFCI